MIIRKITTGFVIQTFDTDDWKYVSQMFVAGDTVDYENVRGDSVSPKLMTSIKTGEEPYLPFDMVQPK